MHITTALNLPTIIGLVGVAVTLVAYALLQTAKITTEQLSYSLLNIVGSLLILYSLCFDWNLSAFLMECLWLLFSVYGLWRILTHHLSKSTRR